MKQTKRSPIKSKPLRYAGKSIDERIDKLVDNAIPYLMASTLCVVVAGNEWLRFYRNDPPSPKTMSFIALIVVGVSIYKTRKIINELKILRLGREGERAVGEYLDLLRENGHRIWHC